MSLDAKLLKLCNVAAQIRSDGHFAGGPYLAEDYGLLDFPMAFVAGELGINAALVGRIDEGTVICYRGTLSPDDSTRTEGERVLDWLGDFSAQQISYPEWPGLVHQGFARAVKSLDDQIERIVGDGMRIYCGHSKGGAMAQLAAFRYSASAGRPCLCTTFGSPRVGNPAFAGAMEQSAVSLRRYEASGDIVPHTPFDSRLAEYFAHVFCSKIPADAFDYHSVGNPSYIHGDGTVEHAQSGFERLEIEGLSLASIGARFARDGFKGVREAHDISPAGLYWKGVNNG